MARLVMELYPEARLEKIYGFEAFVDNGAKHNRLEPLVNERGEPVIVPFELISAVGTHDVVRRSQYFSNSVRGALEFLREKHPAAYVALVEWASQ